jgi:hypothetical protein
MKPHIKVIQRNGVDIFVTSSMTMKATKSEIRMNKRMQGAQGARGAGVSMGYFASASSHNSHLPIGIYHT